MSFIKYSAAFFLLSFCSPSLFAATVAVVKDHKALIKTDHENLQAGDKYFVLNSAGKRVGIVQIKIFKAETQRALALLLKGHAEPRDTLEKLSSAADKEDSAARRNSTALELAETARWDSVGYMNHAWGFLAGYAKNTMKVQLNPSLTTNMSGSSTDFSFFYQQRLDQDFSGRLAIGMESLNAKGTISGVDCNGVSDCNVNVTYLSLNPVIRLSYYRDQSDFWVGGGMNFLQALAKNSTAVKAEKIGTNLALSLSTGIDWNLHNGHFIPLQIEYAMFPGNSTIQVQQLIFRAGYGYSF